MCYLFASARRGWDQLWARAGSRHARGTGRRDSRRKKSEKGDGRLTEKGKLQRGGQIRGDNSIIDNVSPRMRVAKGNTIQKIFTRYRQTVIASRPKKTREESGWAMGGLQRRLNISSSSATASSIVGRSTGS